MDKLKLVLVILFLSCNVSATQLVRPADITRYGVTCKETELVGFGPVMNPEDMQAFNRAKFVCAFKYVYSPCLIKFERLQLHSYHATCGAGKKE